MGWRAVKSIKKIIALIIFLGFMAQLSLSSLFPFRGSAFIFAFLSCITAIVVSWILIGRKFKPIENVFLDTLGRPADEDLAEASKHLSGLLRESYQYRVKTEEMLSGINDIYKKNIQETAAGLYGIINNISSGIQDLKNTISEHASDVGEISSHIASTNKYSEQTSEKTMESAEILSSSSVKIKEMLSAVEASNSEIQRLEEITKEIEKSTEMINDIADQTNLLALNAAIEAARAGEAGRGFSIVADEVRKLAEHSSKATKEIDSKIHAIRESVSLSFDKLKSVLETTQEVSDSNKKATMSASTVIGAISNLDDQINSISSTLSQSRESIDKLIGLTENCDNSATSTRQAIDQIVLHITDIDRKVQQFLKA